MGLFFDVHIPRWDLYAYLLAGIDAHPAFSPTFSQVLPSTGRLDVILDLDIQSRTGFYLIDTLLAGNFTAFRNAIAHLILPAITLGTIPLAIIARMTRSSLLEVLNQPYIMTAYAKGFVSVEGYRQTCDEK